MLAAVLALAGCGGGDDTDDGALVVFAASSLGEVAPRIDSTATVVLGGSNDLAAQLRDGAKAGVFLSASARPVDELRRAGIVETPVAFASNRLVVVTPAANVSGASTLSDLARSGMKLVLGAEGVPAGDYAREALRAAGLEEALAQVVSLEDDVKGVLGKVALGEADAGIVYATDARAAGKDVRSFPIPERFQPQIRYYAAVVAPASDRASAWVERLVSEKGHAALRAAGFLPVSA